MKCSPELPISKPYFFTAAHIQQLTHKPPRKSISSVLSLVLPLFTFFLPYPHLFIDFSVLPITQG